jgi:isopentenyl-diphosphate delta-isomerase
MGFDCELREAFASPDYAEVGGALIEHEYDHVLVGAYEGEPVPDPAEVAEWRWVSTGELRRALFANEDDLQDARQVTVQREGNEDG